MYTISRLILVIVFLLTKLSLSAQIKNDYIWLTGDSGKKNILDFNTGSLIITESDESMGIVGDNASYSDADGNLICYTNGFAIANANHEVYKNGDSLNTGNDYAIIQDGANRGKIGIQELLLLPEPYADSTFYLIHKPNFFNDDSDLKQGYMLYSYLDLKANEGKGEVLEKNVEFFYDEYILSSYLAAIHHENGEDWWIIQPKEEVNTYFIFLLDSMGISLIHEQEIGFGHFWDAGSSGTAKFSNDGLKYAYFNYGDQLRILDFDRSTGLFSEFEFVNINDTLPQIGSSVEWSANSRFIYVSCSFYLYQIDTWNDNEVELISEWSGLSDPFPNFYSLMVQGPDCRIYIRSMNGTDSWHVIHYPDEKGEACGFQEGSLRPPDGGTFWNWPNHPRWRVDEEEKCDASIVSVLGQPVYYVEEMKVYPNPAVDYIKIELPSIGQGDLELYDVNGNLLRKQEWESGSEEYVDLINVPAGLYFIEFIPKDNPKRKVYQGKVVKK